MEKDYFIVILYYYCNGELFQFQRIFLNIPEACEMRTSMMMVRNPPSVHFTVEEEGDSGL